MVHWLYSLSFLSLSVSYFLAFTLSLSLLFLTRTFYSVLILSFSAERLQAILCVSLKLDSSLFSWFFGFVVTPLEGRALLVRGLSWFRCTGMLVTLQDFHPVFHHLFILTKENMLVTKHWPTLTSAVSEPLSNFLKYLLV